MEIQIHKQLFEKVTHHEVKVLHHDEQTAKQMQHIEHQVVHSK